MRRRNFIAGIIGSSAALPLVARAQQADQLRRIGVLSTFGENDPVYHDGVASFRDELSKLGWVEGRNLRIDFRGAGDNATKLPANAAELLALLPEAILAIGPSRLAALQRLTGSVPIVFVGVNDPIAAGFVASLTRPGGNITGFALTEAVIGAKRLELLKQLAPGVNRVGFIYDPSNPTQSGVFAETEAAALSLGMKVSAVPVRDAAEIEAAIDALAREPNGGLIAAASPAVIAYRDKIIALAARHSLPTVYTFRYFVTEGGLSYYGVSLVEQFRGAASYVDRILRGARAGDLPIQFADKFELVINMKTAKALGLDPPISLLARTDEVIE
jgi:putative ABC transport system substrate-binding protein